MNIYESLWHEVTAISYGLLSHSLGHAVKAVGGQLTSPLRSIMMGNFVADHTGALHFGLPQRHIPGQSP